MKSGYKYAFRSSLHLQRTSFAHGRTLTLKRGGLISVLIIGTAPIYFSIFRFHIGRIYAECMSHYKCPNNKWALSLFTVPYLLYIIRLFRFFSGPVRKYGEVTAESAIVHKDQEEPLGRSRRTGLGPVPAVKDSLDIHGGHLPPPHLDQGSHNIPDHIF